jgi:hypothetical protein
MELAVLKLQEYVYIYLLKKTCRTNFIHDLLDFTNFIHGPQVGHSYIED